MIGRVVLAPNAYKGSLGAAAVAEAMAEGIARTTLPVECVVRPMADGGDGSIDAVVTAGFSRVPVTVRGPTGASVAASLAMRGDVAVVELAGTCGMARLSGGSLAPMTSSTLGLGDALRAALDHGAREVIVCLGGSASTDGGAGLLTALGARLLDRRGRPVEPMGRTLDEVADLDLAALHPRLGETTITVAADVRAPLLGPTGAARMFGPQKGATPAEVAHLETGLATWARVLARATGRDVAEVPGSGAAGGTASALLAVMAAGIRPGAELIADEVGLPGAIGEADLVLTGEGRLDAQTGLGKGAAWVAHLADRANRPVLAICGRIDLDAAGMHALGFAAWADCVSQAVDDARAMREAPRLIAEATRMLLESWGQAASP